MGIVVIAGVWLAVSERVSAAPPKPQQVTVANMHIDPAGNHTILPDDFGATYRDYRLPGGDLCVQGEIYSQGLASLVLNRRMDDGTRCSDAGRTPRAFRIVLNHVDACFRLLNAEAPCTHLTPAGMPHVRGETAFKSKTGKTAMTFYFITQYPQHTNWRLTTDVDANLASLSSNTKIVTYDGNMTLAEHQGNPGSYIPVSFGIPMSFQIMFDRVTVTQ